MSILYGDAIARCIMTTFVDSILAWVDKYLAQPGENTDGSLARNGEGTCRKDSMAIAVAG
jgi:hypothetical protein